jgi:hypothetical protein
MIPPSTTQGSDYQAARCAPEEERAPAHAAFTRLLPRQPPDTEALGQEAKAFVDVGKGLWVLDDTTLDKPYAQKMDRVTYHWSGKHQRVVKGITLWTLLWTEGKALIPCDFRVYDKPQGGKTPNEHFQGTHLKILQAMRKQARRTKARKVASRLSCRTVNLRNPPFSHPKNRSTLLRALR